MPYLKETLETYRDTDIYPFHMPGHKRQASHFPNPYEIDITEIVRFGGMPLSDKRKHLWAVGSDLRCRKAGRKNPGGEKQS